MLAAGTRFVKIVPEARSLADVEAVLHLAHALDRGRRADRRAVLFASGEIGRPTRLLGPLLGAPLAYAAWAPERRAAPGQYLPEEMAALIGHLAGRPRRLFAVLGKPVAGSLSPRIHAAAYRALGLPNVFVPLEVGAASELDGLLVPAGASWLDALGLPAGGFAVTMPWKEEAARRCTLLAPRAERAGAANTVLPRAGKVLGDCTDMDGITRVLADEGVELAGAGALVLGAGGAARAAAVALLLGGAEVAIAARDGERAAAAARRLGVTAVEVAASERAVVVVNATPAGADGEPAPWLEALRLPAGGRGRRPPLRPRADLPRAARRAPRLALRLRPRGAALPGGVAVRGDDRCGAAGAGDGGRARPRGGPAVSAGRAAGAPGARLRPGRCGGKLRRLAGEWVGPDGRARLAAFTFTRAAGAFFSRTGGTARAPGRTWGGRR